MRKLQVTLEAARREDADQARQHENQAANLKERGLQLDVREVSNQGLHGARALLMTPPIPSVKYRPIFYSRKPKAREITTSVWQKTSMTN